MLASELRIRVYFLFLIIIKEVDFHNHVAQNKTWELLRSRFVIGTMIGSCVWKDDNHVEVEGMMRKRE